MMTTSRFAVCVRNEGYEVSLELRKLYETLDDADAQECGQIRVIYESCEDYLYPEGFFALFQLPAATEKADFEAG